MKRIFDVILATSALVFLVPILLVVWIIVKLDSPGPAFYRQERVGRFGTSFQIIKFRSMRLNSDAEGFRTVVGDTRITRVGRIIRRLSIDELPQLLNVVIGDMSIVGPRPDVPAQKADYSQEDWQARHSVRPGITGWAQIHGRSIASPEERLARDLEYVRKHSLLMDIHIVWRTIFSLFSKGAY